MDGLYQTQRIKDLKDKMLSEQDMHQLSRH